MGPEPEEEVLMEEERIKSTSTLTKAEGMEVEIPQLGMVFIPKAMVEVTVGTILSDVEGTDALSGAPS